MTAPADQHNQIDETDAEAEAAAAEAEAEAARAEAEAKLGDKGKQALDRMKAERNATKAELAKFKALGLDPDKLQQLIGQSEAAAAEAETQRQRREHESAALAKANERLIRSEVKAAATGKLANPALALRLLDLSSFDVDDDGEVDSAAIAAALDDLVSKEPYLGVAQGDQKRSPGSADAGPKGEAGKPQLTQSDLDRMNAVKDYAGIAKAREDGRFDKLLGISRTS